MSADPTPSNPPAASPAVADHDALPPGTRFGEFEIIRVLGVGGFGIVYLAQDHSLERQVALKEYMPASLASRGAGPVITVRSGAFAETYAVGLRSFINEARLLARFDHPSLVKVYRFWEDNATAYMVMPYLQGSTLRDTRRRMAEPPDEAWIRGVLDPMLDALEQLHREGVFHRDIAPDNILLPPQGAPILLDFGAARRVISDRTQTLTAILKPSYAPIEQYAEMSAMRQGPWTDLYALGAVVHFLLFGVPPAPATARAVQDDAELIEQRVVPGVSPRFMSAVAWMLGVRPVDRPQNVASLRAALSGQIPIPSRVRHDVTVPGATALMPVAGPPPPFAVTRVETPGQHSFEPTLRVEGAYSAPTRLDTAHQPTALMPPPREPAVTPVPAAAATPAGGAPMRSTPPGSPPPAYVPVGRPASAPPAQRAPAASAAAAPVTPAAATPVPAAAGARPTSARRGLVVAGTAGAALIAVAALWQVVGMRGTQRPMAAPTAQAASVPGALPAGAYAGPSVSQVASVPQWGAAVAPVMVAPTPARASDASAGAAGPREICADRKFAAHARCMARECERAEFHDTPECARVLAIKRRRGEP